MKFGPTLTEWTLRGWIHDIILLYSAETVDGRGITAVNSATVYKSKFGMEAKIVYSVTFSDLGMKQIRNARLIKADLIWPKRKSFGETGPNRAKVFIKDARADQIGEYL